MRLSRVASRAVRLALELTPQAYVCRTCLARGIRRFHASSDFAHEFPWWKRTRDTLFGTKASKRADKSREEKQQKRLANASDRDDGELLTKTDSRGRTYEIAEVVDSNSRKDYVPASTWTGLERVGSEEWVRARADRGEQYTGFVAPTQPDVSNDTWRRLLHHVTVEVLTLQQAGRNVLDICLPRAESGSNWVKTAEATLVAGNGATSPTIVSYDIAEAAQEVLSMIPQLSGQEAVVSKESLQEEILGIQNLTQIPKTSMDIDVQHPLIKLAIHKRVMQLTGKRIADPVLSKIRTIGDFYTACSTKQLPKQLAHTEQLQEIAIQAPNVKVYDSRRTVVHRETAVGRWKMIEDELTARGLPVFRGRTKRFREGMIDERFRKPSQVHGGQIATRA